MRRDAAGGAKVTSVLDAVPTKFPTVLWDKGPMHSMMGGVLRSAANKDKKQYYDVASNYNEKILNQPENLAIHTGMFMEEINNGLIDLATQLRATQKDFEAAHNEVGNILDVVGPRLVAEISNIRSARMTLVSEIHQSLAALKDVRKFFLESDYEIEMKRLERFVAVCKELKQLKNEGTLDAVAETSLRLMDKGK